MFEWKVLTTLVIMLILRPNVLIVSVNHRRETTMAEKKGNYADGLRQIHLARGMVRFDLVAFQPAEEEGKAFISESDVRLIMPLQSIL